MPFYEYECQSCKFYTEIMQKISDPPLKKCPSCGRSAMTKLISAPVFRLKGAGWYETDFKSDQEGKRNLAVEKEPESKEAKPDAAASDASKAQAGTADAKSADSKSADGKPADIKPAGARSAAAARSASKRRSPAGSRKPVVKSKGKPKGRPGKKARR